MQKTVICNITMKKEPNRWAYPSDDASIKVSDREVIYPINAFLEKHLEKGDDVKVLLLMHVTAGYHYHTVFAETEEILNEIESELATKGYLVTGKEE